MNNSKNKLNSEIIYNFHWFPNVTYTKNNNVCNLLFIG